MFTIDQKITHTELKDKNILKVYFSMNNHLVATPDTSLEEARSYVFFFREGKGRLSVYIGLHLLLTDRKLFYAHSGNPFSENDLQEVEEEARNFAEDLGAMLDEVDFAFLSDQEQERWINEQSIFSEKKEPEPEPVQQPPQPEVAAEAPAVKSPEARERPASAVEAEREPEIPEVRTEQVIQQSYAEVQEVERPLESPEPTPATKSDQEKSSQLAAAKRRQEITRKTATVGVPKADNQATEKGPLSATGVVSRDREALARLLTSF